jgi:hypothetical protein
VVAIDQSEGDKVTSMLAVDVDRTVREMLKRNISICRYAEAQPHYLAQRGLIPTRMCPRFCFDDSRHGLPLLREMLTKPDSLESPLFQLLFRSLVYGEYRFVKTFVPQNSNEERLTGHLISELSGALAVAEAAFESQSEEIYGEKARLEFHYADMSSDSMEAVTGADFALVMHLNLPDRPESARVAICQAKKLYKNGQSLAVDGPQLDHLIGWAEEGAFYCFYDMDPNSLWAPTVMPAREVKNRVEQKAAKQKERGRVGDEENPLAHKGLLTHYESVPMSVFLLFDMLIAQRAGKRFDNIWSASRFVTGGAGGRRESQRPSRVLMVSVGGATGRGEQPRHLSDLFPVLE